MKFDEPNTLSICINLKGSISYKSAIETERPSSAL